MIITKKTADLIFNGEGCLLEIDNHSDQNEVRGVGIITRHISGKKIHCRFKISNAVLNDAVALNYILQEKTRGLQCLPKK